ncbi:DUF6000 family protein [Streptomyces sp. 1268]|uniref:DUF6000 family protein n=1 Tax=Streptomyces sp. 1268 TaxID=3231942 RepID=UPI0038D3F8AC
MKSACRKGYCFALARLGAHEDAEILAAYLERYPPPHEPRYEQPEALGALLRLDAQLSVAHSGPFMATTVGSQP